MPNIEKYNHQPRYEEELTFESGWLISSTFQTALTLLGNFPIVTWVGLKGASALWPDAALVCLPLLILVSIYCLSSQIFFDYVLYIGTSASLSLPSHLLSHDFVLCPYSKSHKYLRDEFICLLAIYLNESPIGQRPWPSYWQNLKQGLSKVSGKQCVQE